MTTRVALLAGLLAVLLTAPSITQGRTWRVEKGGGGDYKVIQDAVDAAASGDTIRIGRGRFDEMQLVSCPGWTENVIVLVKQDELTIIGEGPETIIGCEEPWDDESDMRKGIVFSDHWGCHHLTVEDLRIENMREGIYTGHASDGENDIFVNRCAFHDNLYGVGSIGDGGTLQVSDCTFRMMPHGGSHLAAWHHSKVEVSRCQFELQEYNYYPQFHLSLWGDDEVLYSDCTFLEGDLGITAAHAGPIRFERCVFDGQSHEAVYASAGTIMFLDGCTFRNQHRIMNPEDSDLQLHYTRCNFESVSDIVFSIGAAMGLSVTGCDILPGSRGAIESRPHPDPPQEGIVLDFEDNYWGTDDPDSIRSLISDRNQNSEAWFYIDYEPFRSESTPNQPKSFSSMKALFQG